MDIPIKRKIEKFLIQISLYQFLQIKVPTRIKFVSVYFCLLKSY